MSDRRALDLALSVLDLQLVDDEGRRCGRVDDVELVGDLETGLTVEALLTGGTARRDRAHGVFRLLLSLADRTPKVRIAWSEVRDVTHVVKLARPADELRLARHDARAKPFVQRIPKS